jgi:hypothetical protein
VLEARDLIDKDPDIFAKVCHGKEVEKTETLKKAIAPSWSEEIFFFPVQAGDDTFVELVREEKRERREREREREERAREREREREKEREKEGEKEKVIDEMSSNLFSLLIL